MISTNLVLVTGLLLFSLFLGRIIIQWKTILTFPRKEYTSTVVQTLQDPFSSISFPSHSVTKHESGSSDTEAIECPIDDAPIPIFPYIYPALPSTLDEKNQTSIHVYDRPARTSDDENPISPIVYPHLPEGLCEEIRTPTPCHNLRSAIPNIYPDLSETQRGERAPLPDDTPVTSAATDSCPSNSAPPVSPETRFRNLSTLRKFKITSLNDPRTRADFLPKRVEDLLQDVLQNQSPSFRQELRAFVDATLSGASSLSKGQLRRMRRDNFRRIWGSFVKKERPLYLRNKGRIPPEVGLKLEDQKYPCKYISPPPQYQLTL